MSATVLIVDDSLTVRMDLSDAFSGAGFRALPCGTAREALELSRRVLDLDGDEHTVAIESLGSGGLGRVIRRHEGDPKWVLPRGGEIHEPRRLEYDVETKPPDVEVSAFDMFIRHDYRVQILDVHVPSSAPLWSAPSGK